MTEAPSAPAAPAATPAAKPASVTPAVTPAAPALLKPTEPRPLNPVLAEPSVFDEHFKSYDKTAKPAAPAEKKPEQPVDKPQEAKPEAAKEEAVKAEVPPVDKPAEAAEQFKTNKELRNAYETTKQKASKMEAKIKEFEAKLAQAEKSGTVADEKVWQERIAAKEKELAETRSKLAETDFTQSAEYQTKFYQPYVNAWKRATAAITALPGVDETGAAVAVTPQQVELILSLPDAQAMKLARQMFGDDVGALSIFVAHKNEIAKTMEAVNQGRADFQKLSEERRTREFTERQQQGELIGKLWKQGNEAIAAKSKWFRADEADPEGSELLSKGFEIADKAFMPDDAMKPEDRVALHVQLRNRAAAYDRLVSNVDKLQAQVDALTKERDELMDSAPKGDTSTQPKAVEDANKTMTQKIDEFFKKR